MESTHRHQSRVAAPDVRKLGRERTVRLGISPNSNQSPMGPIPEPMFPVRPFSRDITIASMVLGETDVHGQKNELGLYFNHIQRSLKVDQTPQCKS